MIPEPKCKPSFFGKERNHKWVRCHCNGYECKQCGIHSSKGKCNKGIHVFCQCGWCQNGKHQTTCLVCKINKYENLPPIEVIS